MTKTRSGPKEVLDLGGHDATTIFIYEREMRNEKFQKIEHYICSDNANYSRNEETKSGTVE